MNNFSATKPNIPEKTRASTYSIHINQDDYRRVRFGSMFGKLSAASSFYREVDTAKTFFITLDAELLAQQLQLLIPEVHMDFHNDLTLEDI